MYKQNFALLGVFAAAALSLSLSLSLSLLHVCIYQSSRTPITPYIPFFPHFKLRGLINTFNARAEKRQNMHG